MGSRYLLVGLLCLGWWLTAGCTPPTEPAPTKPATTPILTATPTPATITPTPAVALLPAIPTTPPEPTASPLPTPLPTPDLFATQTARAAVYTPPPTITPTITLTPSPTFTPIPGPVWRMLFRAIPCPLSNTSCEPDLFLNNVPQWYLINSDGSGLMALRDTDTFLADIWDHPRLSPDRTHLAYLAGSMYGDTRVKLAEISSGRTFDLGVTPQVFRGLKFLPEPGCLAIFSISEWHPETDMTTLIVTKLCADSTERQVLETIEIPSVTLFLPSPQGDALLLGTESSDSNRGVYVYESGSQEPLRLLYAIEGQPWFPYGPARWLPDGQGVEFFMYQFEIFETSRFRLGNVLLYGGNRQATDIQAKLELELPFTFLAGDWSPDGRELAFFPGMLDHTPETLGIYILDLESGEWRQIVSGFYMFDSYFAQIRAWPAEVP